MLSGITWTDPKGISDSILSKNLVQANDLDADSRDLIEVAERLSIRQLKVFLQRCIDSIEFVYQISIGKDTVFAKIVQNLTDE